MISWKNELILLRNQGAWLKSLKCKINSYVKLAKDGTKPPCMPGTIPCGIVTGSLLKNYLVSRILVPAARITTLITLSLQWDGQLYWERGYPQGNVRTTTHLLGAQKKSKKGQNRQIGFDPVRFMDSIETHCLISSRTDLDAVKASHHANILTSSKK